MATNWTKSLREQLGKRFPPEQVLPDQQPA
jgi:hypothetical protein